MQMEQCNPYVRFASAIQLSGVYRPTVSCDHRLFYFLKGDGGICINGKTYSVSDNTAVLFPAGSVYLCRPKEKIATQSFNFDYTQAYCHLTHPLRPVEAAKMGGRESVGTGGFFGLSRTLSAHLLGGRRGAAHGSVSHHRGGAQSEAACRRLQFFADEKGALQGCASGIAAAPAKGVTAGSCPVVYPQALQRAALQSFAFGNDRLSSVLCQPSHEPLCRHDTAYYDDWANDQDFALYYALILHGDAAVG